jgi:hypothetical protein
LILFLDAYICILSLKTTMPMSSKKWFIASITLVSVLFPRLELNSCVPDTADEDFRVWLFQPNLVNDDALIPFTYSSNLYFHPGGRGQDMSEPSDSTFEKMNVAEWQAELPAAKPKDIHTLLYETPSMAYFRRLKGDSLKQNTFLQALKSQKELFEYFNFAKECESAFGGGLSEEDTWEWKSDSLALNRIVPKAEKMIQTAKSSFVRLRTAFQLIKTYEYLQNTEGVIKTFDAHIKNAKTKSWIVGSAMYYYAKAQPEGLPRNLAAANCFEQTIDKKFQSLKLLDMDKRKDILAPALNKYQRAILSVMLSLRNPARALEDLKTVYTANPEQKELPMLVEREINKLEDWLFSYKLTGSDTYISRYQRGPMKKNENGGYDFDDPITNEEKKYVDIQKNNWASDRLYLNDVMAFVDKLIADNKLKDRSFLHLSAAHLAFLKQDFKKTQEYLAILRGLPNVRTTTKVQAELTNLLCELYATPKISPMVEETIARFEATLQSAKKDITDFDTFREQVYFFLSKKFLKDGSFVKGCLLSMMTDRSMTDSPLEGYEAGSGYIRLYAGGKPADFDEVLRILTTPKTPFEQILAAEKRPYKEHEWYYDKTTENWTEKNNPRAWDLNKIKDYKATYYIRQNQIDSAMMVYKTIPRTKWQEEPYRSMLNCNPFYIDLQHPHAPTVADSTRYDKFSCIERMITLRNSAAKTPSVSAQNHYLLGNAYFNMSGHGNFWLMSDISWSSGGGYSGYFENDTAFLDNYFGLDWAKTQYELCLKKTSDEKLAALCHFMIGYCAKMKTEHYYYRRFNRWDEQTKEPKIGENPANGIFKNKFPNRINTYTKADYWCTNYESLALHYSGF